MPSGGLLSPAPHESQHGPLLSEANISHSEGDNIRTSRRGACGSVRLCRTALGPEHTAGVSRSVLLKSARPCSATREAGSRPCPRLPVHWPPWGLPRALAPRRMRRRCPCCMRWAGGCEAGGLGPKGRARHAPRTTLTVLDPFLQNRGYEPSWKVASELGVGWPWVAGPCALVSPSGFRRRSRPPALPEPAGAVPMQVYAAGGTRHRAACDKKSLQWCRTLKTRRRSSCARHGLRAAPPGAVSGARWAASGRKQRRRGSAAVSVSVLVGRH